MNPSSDKSDYLLLFRNTVWHQELSPEEIQITMTHWMNWFDGLVEKGQCKGGQSLAKEGKLVTGIGQSVSDGPFTESKEAVAGYFLLHVEGIEEALAIAKQCPALVHGITVEVRPLLQRCMASQRLLDERLKATA